MVFGGVIIPQGLGNAYASGTIHAKSGEVALAADVQEVIFCKYGTLVPINQLSFTNLSGGEMVFNHEMTQRLWDMAKQPLTSSVIQKKDVYKRQTLNISSVSLSVTVPLYGAFHANTAEVLY